MTCTLRTPRSSRDHVKPAFATALGNRGLDVHRSFGSPALTVSFGPHRFQAQEDLQLQVQGGSPRIQPVAAGLVQSLKPVGRPLRDGWRRNKRSLVARWTTNLRRCTFRLRRESGA